MTKSICFNPILIALLPLSIGLVPPVLLNRQPKLAGKLGVGLALAGLGLAIISVGNLGQQPTVVQSFGHFGPARLGIYYDALSVVLTLLVAFLAAVILQFSRHYLDGDPRQGEFMRWLSLTAGFVLLLVISGNLLMFALAWSAVSLCLHQLLVFYPDRPGALLAARKKYLFSRLGDLCLVGALILIYREFHTWELSDLFNLARSPGVEPARFAISGFLLVLCAMLKSAQFPFHSWLPDTMETPTPVSALMHAGVINGGGFLVVRFSPFLVHCPVALSFLTVLGCFTALFASLTMLTHASVKRALAFSTVAQMGFMMLECGLGLFSLAVLHLLAHSLYKAYAFLSSGSILQLARAKWIPLGQSRPTFPLFLGSLLTTALMILTGDWLLEVGIWRNPETFFMGVILWLSLTYLLWNLWLHSQSPGLYFVGTGMVGFLVLTGFSLHRLFECLLVSVTPNFQPTWSSDNSGLILVPLSLFLAVLLFQSQLPHWNRHPWVGRWYVHARNGFYFTTLANRWVQTFWPSSTAKSMKPT